MALHPYTQFRVCRFLIDRAKELPDEDSITSACQALQGCSVFTLGLESESIRNNYLRQNYHDFVREMLSDSRVSSNSTLIQILYNTFQEILEVLYDDDDMKDAVRAEIHTPALIKSFVGFFIRDATAYKDQLAHILGAACFFVPELEGEEQISILKELDFHTVLYNVLDSCETAKAVCLAVQLLASMADKYCSYLKLKIPFQDDLLMDVLLEKAKLLHSHSDFDEEYDILFSTNFDKISRMLLMDKDISKKLFEDGYLSKLLDVFDCLGNTHVRACILFIIDDMAEAVEQARNLLLEKQFYASLFPILNGNMDVIKPSLTRACCNVLSDLALGDIVKKRYVKSGFIKILFEFARVHGTSELYPALEVLGKMSDINVMNRHFVITTDVLHLLKHLLENSEDSNSLILVVSILADFCELDIGPVRLEELGMVSALETTVTDSFHSKESSVPKACGMELLEKVFLYALPRIDELVIPPMSSNTNSSYWPPNPGHELYLEDEGMAPSTQDSPTMNIPQLGKVKYLEPSTPTAPELSASAQQELSSLGVDPSRQVFRIGRLHGATYSNCPNCQGACVSNFFSYLIFKPLSMTIEQYQDLVDRGWYRMGRVNMHRLINCHKVECGNWETRISVKEFDHMKHKSNKKILKRILDIDLTVEKCHAHFSEEAFQLYNDYHIKKHGEPPKSVEMYCDHMVNTPITNQVKDGIEYGTFHLLYRVDGKLVAVSVVDVIPKGIISVYMWYDVSKDAAKYSLGKYSILKEIEMVRDMSERSPAMMFYYLQGWNGKNTKLSYKGDYEPEEFYCPCLVDNWVCGLDNVKECITKMTEKNANPSEPEEVQMDPHEEELPPEKKLKSDSMLEISPAIEGEEESVHPTLNRIENKAFPLDMKRCEGTFGSSLDISRVVICLNHTKYLHLDSLIKHMDKDVQKETIETRIKELYVALSPELRNQLVIDMMVPDI